MGQGGGPAREGPGVHSQQECHRLALHCTHRESTATRGTGQGLGCAQGWGSWREQHELGIVEQPTPPAKLCYCHQGDSPILLSKELKNYPPCPLQKKVPLNVTVSVLQMQS